ncbi:hypothetical protein [Streptomyces sp. ISL-98]|uniref:hypothetical protein n=1 Tax=Streptomyces sp. ISL-98 TaxID=2819192 RepID=UPI00203557AD|nr:hypothetical protein [Streptomyces sp. ISL-98]
MDVGDLFRQFGVADRYGDPDRDPKALLKLFEDWETETMHAHGWARAPQPEARPSPPAHLSLVPRGQG